MNSPMVNVDDQEWHSTRRPLFRMPSMTPGVAPSNAPAFLPPEKFSELLPESLSVPFQRSPIYSPDPIFFLLPQLIDALAGKLPEDAGNWESVEISIPGGKERDEKRLYVALHLLETEQNYVKDLQLLTNLFRKGLLEQDLITEMQAKLIFEGVDELLEVHVRFSQAMEKAIEDAGGATAAVGARIGRLFMDHKQILVKVYTRFIEGYSTSQKELQKLYEQSPQFNKFMSDVRKSAKNQGLKELIVTPVQRTTRYQLILSDLSKYTTESNPDYEDLKQALSEMLDLATIINQQKKKEEDREMLFNTYQSIENCPATLVSDKRRVLISSTVTLLSEGANQLRTKVQLFVCSDLVMICSIMKMPAKSGGRFLGGGQKSENVKPFAFMRWLDMREIEVEDATDQYQFGIRINHVPNANGILTTYEFSNAKHATVYYFKAEDQKDYDHLIKILEDEIERVAEH
ncbi:Dbl homology domain-containing protein [Cladochytrium replicatum]|nr:Dbl homology domain-containing protein [Cladochytrium replicatum]